MNTRIEIKIIEKNWWCSVHPKTLEFIDEPTELIPPAKASTTLTDTDGNVLKVVYEADSYEELIQLKEQGINIDSRISTPISNHPTDQSINRIAYVVDFINFNFISSSEIASLRIYVKHFRDGEPLPNMNDYVIIYATKHNIIPQLGISMFDYLYQLVNTGTSLEDICKLGIAFADGDKTIDKKLYGSI